MIEGPGIAAIMRPYFNEIDSDITATLLASQPWHRVYDQLLLARLPVFARLGHCNGELLRSTGLHE